MKKKPKAVAFGFEDGNRRNKRLVEIQKFCALLSERDDIFYGTVGEALLSDIRYK